MIDKFKALLERINEDEIISVLTAKDFNPNAKDDIIGTTLLHVAAEVGRDSIAWSLLKLGANTNTENISHLTPLQVAINCGHADIVHTIANHSDCKITNKTLKYAEDHLTNAREFADHNKSINAKKTLETLRCAYARKLVLKICKDACFKKDSTFHDLKNLSKLLSSQPDIANITNYNGNTLLHYAAIYGILPLVQLLLENGASPALKNDKGDTPFDITPPNKKLVKQALKNTEPDKHVQDNSKLIERSNEHFIRSLVSNICFIETNRHKIIRLFQSLEDHLTYNREYANIQHPTTGNSLLHTSAFYENIELTAILLHHGTNPTHVNVSGETALDIAIEKGHQVIMKMLQRCSTRGTQIIHRTSCRNVAF